MKKPLLCQLFVAAFVVAGCGGEDPQPTTFSLATTGQQLTDLRIAYDRGVITEEEYYRKRAQLLQ